jgi:predicted lipase
MLASYYVYADRIGATDFEDFKLKYTEKFKTFGFDKFDFISRRKKTGDTQLVVMSNSSTVLVVFRGSEGFKGSFKNLSRAVYDWLLTDLNFFKKRVSWWGRGVKIHRGFYNALEIVYDDLKKICLEHIDGTQKKLWVTGHSLGAGLATLASFRLENDGIPVQGVYVYGSPKVGNDNFAAVFSAKISNFQRWVNDNDLVVRLPFKWMRYVHIGSPNNIYADGHFLIGAVNFKGKPKVTSHPPIRYLQGLYSALPMSVKIEVPAPPSMIGTPVVDDPELEMQLLAFDEE